MEFIRVEDCCEILDSQRKPVTESERIPGMYPYYGANGMQGTINQYIFDDKLVLVAEDGGHFGSKTKPIAYLVNGQCWVNNHAHVLRSKKGFLAEYICYSLMFYKIESYINGATRQKLTQAALRKLLIPKRSVEYQKAIVDRLDLVRYIIEKRQNIINELDLLIKSRFVEMFGNPIINDKKYPVFKLKDISQKIGSGVTPRGGDSNYIDKGVAFIRSMNVYNNTFKKENLVYIDESLAKQLCQVELFSNDLLLNITGASVARCCTVPDDILPARVNQHVCIIRQCRISNVFLEYCLTNESYQEYLLLLSNKNGATREALTKIQVENLEVIFPPLTEITRFVKIVHQINKLKSDVQKSIDETQLLMDSLMQEYFG